MVFADLGYCGGIAEITIKVTIEVTIEVTIKVISKIELKPNYNSGDL